VDHGRCLETPDLRNYVKKIDNVIGMLYDWFKKLLKNKTTTAEDTTSSNLSEVQCGKRMMNVH